MKKCLLFFIMLSGLNACVNNTLQDQKVIEDSLKTSLNKYLHQNTVSARYHINYDIKKVSFFKEADIYLSEFTVHMTSDSAIKGKILDTEGVMKFRISKDFMIISRDY